MLKLFEYPKLQYYRNHPAKASSLFAKGFAEKAEGLLERALRSLPSTTFHLQETAYLRTICLTVLSDFFRKQNKAWDQQVSLLSEASDLIKKFPSVITDKGRDDKTNIVYIIHMNLAVAAGKTGKYLKEEQALITAFLAAGEPENKCKSAAFLVKNLLIQRTRINEARNYVDQFNQAATEAGQVPEELLGLMAINNSILYLIDGKILLAKDELASARNRFPYSQEIQKAINVFSSEAQAPAQLSEGLLRVIEAEVINAGSISVVGLPAGSTGLPALPPWLIPTIQDRQPGNLSNEPVSEKQFNKLRQEIERLIKAGQHNEAVKLIQGLILKTNFGGRYRFEAYKLLAFVLKESGEYLEALPVTEEVILAAHQFGGLSELIIAVDLRAEVLAFLNEFPEALRTLELAERYLENKQAPDYLYLKVWLNHTRGMILTGIGWWEEAIIAFSQAIQSFEYLRFQDDAARAKGDFVNLAIEQIRKIGFDPDLNKKALGYAKELEPIFQKKGHYQFQVKVTIDALFLEKNEAVCNSNEQALTNIKLSAGRFIQQLKKGFFAEPGNVGIHFRWLELLFDLDHTTITWGLCDQGTAQVIFREQLKTLDLGLRQYPQSQELWHLKIKTHLCRIRQQVNRPVEELSAASQAFVYAFDGFNQVAGNYPDPQLKASLKNSMQNLAQDLAETAFYWQEEGPAYQTEIGNLIELSQNLYNQQKSDFARTNIDFFSPALEGKSIKDMFHRILLLSQWPLTKKELQGVYPEYSILDSQTSVLEEITRLKDGLSRSLPSYNKSIKDVGGFQGVDLKAVQNTLQKGEIILQYFIGTERQYAAIIEPLHITIVQLQRYDGVQRDLEGLRYFAGESARDSLTLPLEASQSGVTAGQILSKLSNWLFPPELKNHLIRNNVERIFIVAYDLLLQIPFACLDFEGQLIIERFDVCLVPGLALKGEQKPEIRGKNYFAIGHKGTPSLTYVEEEVRQVKDLISATLYLQEDAQPKTLLDTVLPTANLVHWACHAEIDPVSPLFSNLLLEPDSEHPQGKLFLYEILQSKTAAELICIFACQAAHTGNSRAFPESLALGFLGIGASQVIATRWAVLDQDCKVFSEHLYSALKNNCDILSAYRIAMREQIKYIKRETGKSTLIPVNLLRMACFSLFRAA